MGAAVKNIWALVIESDPVNLLIISNVLKEQGVHFKRNTTGANVVSQAIAMNPHPDFILVSAHVTGGGAVTILKQIRADERLRSIPVIATVDDDSAAPSESAGFAAVVRKSQLRKELSAALNRILSDDEDETEPTRPDKRALPRRGS